MKWYYSIQHIFEIKWDTPNANTLTAIAEVEEMEKHLKLAKTYSSVDELMEDLLK